MGNRYEITLDSVWAKWATEHGVPETIAAALFLLSKKRKAEVVVDRLEPDELKVVVEVVENSPECFPQGTLTALKDRRPTSPTSARSGPPGAKGNPYGIQLNDEDLRWAAAEGVPEAVIAAVRLLPERGVTEVVAKLTRPQLAQVIKLVGLSPSAYPPGTLDALKSKAGTSPETRAETARRRMAVEDLMKAGLSVRTIAAGTNIPRSSVHRAMCAIVRAEAKRQIAIAKIAEKLLGKSLRPTAEGRDD
jgi:hypothetical protein